MSYRNNQFYYPVSAGESAGGTDGTNGIPSAGNPRFTYPDNSVRTAFNGSLVSKRLERGYIRSLLTEAQGQQVPLKKCRFQFNPAQLAQSVSMNSSMLNFFMQDPAQLAQPLASEVTFGFDVLFDRSMEMNNPVNQGDFDSVNPWATGDPSEVGVLRDISTFYAVIGQGISEDQAEFAKAQYTNTLNAEFNDAEGSIEDADRLEALSRLNEYTSNININVGNTAFLMPLPVRVLFSSLFMVEGYVTNTTVVYTKFNTSMVPMQATMSVSMRALYLGFAKKDTFITENIKKTIEAERAEAQEVLDAKTEKRDAYVAAAEELSVLEWYVADSTRERGSNTTNRVGLNFMLGSTSIGTRLFMFAPNARTDGYMASLFNSGETISITFQLLLKVYGPFDNLGQIAIDGKPKNSPRRPSSPILSLSATSTIISSLDQWMSIANGAGYSGESASPTVSILSGDLDLDKFYSVIIDGAATMKIGSTVVTPKVLPNVRRSQGTNEDFFEAAQEGKVSLLWSTVFDDSVDSLPPIPDAVEAPRSSTSTVGEDPESPRPRGRSEG